VKTFFKVVFIPLALIALTACSDLDVVARDAITSFKALTAALPPVAHESG
jgi:hypothetical protein